MKCDDWNMNTKTQIIPEQKVFSGCNISIHQVGQNLPYNTYLVIMRSLAVKCGLLSYLLWVGVIRVVILSYSHLIAIIGVIQLCQYFEGGFKERKINKLRKYSVTGSFLFDFFLVLGYKRSIQTFFYNNLVWPDKKDLIFFLFGAILLPGLSNVQCSEIS